jgi:hypothetical protein
LKNHPESSVVVFAVWEPILPTDWSAPGTSLLHRLNDRRVRQFWDPGHVLAAVIKKAETSGQLHPDCCERKRILLGPDGDLRAGSTLGRDTAGAGSPEWPN